MKGKEYTKATVAADAAQTQQLTDEPYYAKTWTDKKEKKLRRWKLRMSRSMMIFLVLDFLSIILASFASILVRYEFQFDLVEQRFVDTIIWYMPINFVVTVVVYYLFSLYTTLWKYAGITELCKITAAAAVSSILQVVGMLLLRKSIFRSYVLLYFVLLLAETIATRFYYRFLRLIRNKYFRVSADKRMNLMLVGAGDAGAAVIKETRLSKESTRKVCCIVDREPSKWGKRLLGVPIIGDVSEIPEAVEKYQIKKILITIPSANRQAIRKIVEICQTTPCEINILPGIYQLIDGEIVTSRLRNVKIEDLLEREPVRVDLDAILGYIQGKTVLVTGGGGSIGSEICRQLAGHGVGKLIIFDIYENNAYSIQKQLEWEYPSLDMEVLIGSVRNESRVEDIFKTYHPEIVFHAASHVCAPPREKQSQDDMF